MANVWFVRDVFEVKRRVEMLGRVEGSGIIASSLQCFDNMPAKESASTNNKVGRKIGNTK